MGNTAPRRKAGMPAGTEVVKRSKNVAEAGDPAAPKRVAVTQRRHIYGREEKVTTPPAEQRRAGGGAPASTVKIVMRRKDAEALVARLHAQSARERRARMAELKRELMFGDDDAGGGANPAWCLDTLRLHPIQENQCG
jgi:hypothetical protein